MNNVEQAQVALENLNKEKAIFFKEIDTICKDENAFNILSDIHNKLINGVFTFKESEIKTLGAFLFVLGYDYLLQTKNEQKHIVDNVILRLSKIDFTVDSPEIQKLLEICNFISENKTDFIYKEFSGLYEECESKLDSNEFVQNTIGEFHHNLLIKNLENVVYFTISPVGYYNVFDSIKEKGLTISNFMQICKYLSDIAETDINSYLLDLYSDKQFQYLTLKAQEILDDCKLLLIFCEVAAMMESTPHNFKFTLKGGVEEPETETETETETEPTISELTSIEKEKVVYNEKNNPHQFIYGLFFKNEINSFKNFDENVYSSLVENLEYLQYLYQYMTKNIDVEEKDEFNLSENEKNDLIKFNQELYESIESTKAEYKRISELICAEIPKKTLKKLVKVVYGAIYHLILSTPQQKQYLLSQLFENGISTYNHLMQIISVIETCKIQHYDKCIDNYRNLISFLNENNNIKKAYEESKKLDNLTSKIMFYQKFHDFLKKLV